MPYQIHVTTTDGGAHVRPVESIEAIDAFLAQVQYRGEGRMVAISLSPITLVYSTSIESVTINGVTKEEIDEYVRKQHEAVVAEKQHYAAVETARNGVLGTYLPGGQLASLVR